MLVPCRKNGLPVTRGIRWRIDELLHVGDAEIRVGLVQVVRSAKERQVLGRR